LSVRADYSQNLGRLPDPCPECGKKGLSQGTCFEGDVVHVVKSCRYCRAQWIDGARTLPRRGAATDDVVVNATNNVVTDSTKNSLVELADALEWLARQERGTARAIIYDPPYSRYSPMRGREDGAAGKVAAPFKFMHQTMSLCARAVMPKGIVMIFCDWELLPDIAYIASISGLREQAHLTWCRSRPGGGGLFRGACDPVLIASRTPPDRVDMAAVKNWVVADYEIPRAHPYSKPPEVIEYVLARVCRRGDLILDPFAGSGSSRVAAEKLGLDLVWRGCDIDPQYAETMPAAGFRETPEDRESLF
jgi:adenine-specific DNA-methyltransferase